MRNEIWGWIYSLVSIFLVISLTSYIPIDTFQLFQHRLTHVTNLGGIVGAVLSEFFLGTIGVAGYVSILLSVWMANCAFRGIPMKSQFVRWLGISIAAVLLSISLHLFFQNRLPEASLLQGGWLGRIVGSFLQNYFNTTGSLLIVSTGFVITFIMSTKIFISQWVQHLLRDEELEENTGDEEIEEEKPASTAKATPAFAPKTVSKPAAKKSRKKKADSAAALAVNLETEEEETADSEDGAASEPIEESGTGEKGAEPDFTFQPLIPYDSSYPEPSTRLLKGGDGGAKKMSRGEMKELSKKLCEHLLSFQITGDITAVAQGPVLTTYEYKPNAGMKLSKIAALQDDLGVVLGTRELRVVAPIPGKTVVGFEVPRPETETISLKDLVSNNQFYEKKLKIPIAIGKSTTGEPVFGDLTAMPHLLVAGATGSGKSVFINSLIMSLIYRLSPQDLRMILVDPKMLELSVFEGLPHLVTNVITNNSVAYNALAWAVLEMERRYHLMAQTNSKNIDSFNSKNKKDRFPYIVIVVDELADLMMSGGERVEIAITRLAQKARAAGIHLVIATQRPSTDVVTGLIKANIPSRISFKVPSGIDSRTILDTGGAEDLLGRGDSLMIQPAVPIRRLHGCFVSEEELSRVVKYVKGGKDHSRNYISFPTVMPPEEG